MTIARKKFSKRRVIANAGKWFSPIATGSWQYSLGPDRASKMGVKVTVQKQNKIGLDKFTATIVPCRIPQLVFTFNQGLVLFGLLLAILAVIRQLIAN